MSLTNPGLMQGASASAVIASGWFLHSYHSLNPEKAYALALKQLRASPALIEVRGSIQRPASMFIPIHIHTCTCSSNMFLTFLYMHNILGPYPSSLHTVLCFLPSWTLDIPLIWRTGCITCRSWAPPWWGASCRWP